MLKIFAELLTQVGAAEVCDAEICTAEVDAAEELSNYTIKVASLHTITIINDAD